MKSKAAIGNHPIHPALITIPIGAWFATFVGDLAYIGTNDAFWYQFSYWTMLIGIVGALAAAVPGLIDYFGVKMSEAGYRKAKLHMTINLCVVAAYAVNLWLRHDNGALASMAPGRWQLALWLQVLSFAALGFSGYLGGSMAFEHKVGVPEMDDPEADRIGHEEPATPQRVPHRERGMQG
jgi:uncharacterized membrane protein